MLKRVVCIALCIIIILTLVPLSSALAASEYDTIRVRLTVGTTTNVSFFIDGNYSVQQNTSIPLDRQLYSVKLEGGLLKL